MSSSPDVRAGTAIRQNNSEPILSVESKEHTFVSSGSYVLPLRHKRNHSPGSADILIGVYDEELDEGGEDPLMSSSKNKKTSKKCELNLGIRADPDIFHQLSSSSAAERREKFREENTVGGEGAAKFRKNRRTFDRFGG